MAVIKAVPLTIWHLAVSIVVAAAHAAKMIADSI